MKAYFDTAVLVAASVADHPIIPKHWRHSVPPERRRWKVTSVHMAWRSSMQS